MQLLINCGCTGKIIQNEGKVCRYLYVCYLSVKSSKCIRILNLLTLIVVSLNVRGKIIGYKTKALDTLLGKRQQ